MCGGGLGKVLGEILPLAVAYFFPPAGSIAMGVAEGAATGAASSALEGGNVGKGALYGGAVGGIDSGIAGGFSGAGAPAADASGGVSSAGSTGLGTIPGDAGYGMGGSGVSTAPDFLSSPGWSAAAADTGSTAFSSLPYLNSFLPAGSTGMGTIPGETGYGSMGGVRSMIAPNSNINPNLTNPNLAPTTPGVGNISPAGAGPGVTPPPETSMLSDVLDFAKKNKNLLAPGLGLGLSMAQQAKIGDMLKQQPQLYGSANMLSSAANPLIQSLNTGQLPPGGQEMVNQAVQSEEAAVKAKYAQLGLSGSTMETQELNSVKEHASALQFQLANQAVTTGLNMLGQSNDIYTSLAKMQLQGDQGLQQALASFAGSAMPKQTP